MSAPVPRDAATLVLLRRVGDGFATLMGQRGGRASFMPNKVVFPGGALDAEDAEIRSDAALSAPCAERLERASAPALGVPLALAAIRETFEETGLRIATAGPAPSAAGGAAGPSWSAFDATPALDRLRFFFRAVTPPHLPKRFDARFFIAPAAAILGDPDDFSAASGELSYLEWVPLAEARARELPFITEVVLAELEALAAQGVDLAGPSAAGVFERREVPFFRHDADGAHFVAL